MKKNFLVFEIQITKIVEIEAIMEGFRSKSKGALTCLVKESGHNHKAHVHIYLVIIIRYNNSLTYQYKYTEYSS